MGDYKYIQMAVLCSEETMRNIAEEYKENLSSDNIYVIIREKPEYLIVTDWEKNTEEKYRRYTEITHFAENRREDGSAFNAVILGENISGVYTIEAAWDGKSVIPIGCDGIVVPFSARKITELRKLAYRLALNAESGCGPAGTEEIRDYEIARFQGGTIYSFDEYRAVKNKWYTMDEYLNHFYYNRETKSVLRDPLLIKIWEMDRMFSGQD